MLIQNPKNYKFKVSNHYLYTKNQLTVYLDYHRKVYNQLILNLRSYNRYKPLFLIAPDLIDFGQIYTECEKVIPDFKADSLWYFGPTCTKTRILLNIVYYACEALNCQFFWANFEKMKSYLSLIPSTEGRKLLTMIKRCQKVNSSNYNVFVLRKDSRYTVVKLLCPVNPYLYSEFKDFEVDLVVPFNQNLLFVDYMNDMQSYSLRLVDYLKWKHGLQ